MKKIREKGRELAIEVEVDGITDYIPDVTKDMEISEEVYDIWAKYAGPHGGWDKSDESSNES